MRLVLRWVWIRWISGRSDGCRAGQDVLVDTVGDEHDGQADDQVADDPTEHGRGGHGEDQLDHRRAVGLDGAPVVLVLDVGHEQRVVAHRVDRLALEAGVRVDDSERQNHASGHDEAGVRVDGHNGGGEHGSNSLEQKRRGNSFVIGNEQ